MGLAARESRSRFPGCSGTARGLPAREVSSWKQKGISQQQRDGGEGWPASGRTKGWRVPPGTACPQERAGLSCCWGSGDLRGFSGKRCSPPWPRRMQTKLVWALFKAPFFPGPPRKTRLPLPTPARGTLLVSARPCAVSTPFVGTAPVPRHPWCRQAPCRSPLLQQGLLGTRKRRSTVLRALDAEHCLSAPLGRDGGRRLGEDRAQPSPPLRCRQRRTVGVAQAPGGSGAGTAHPGHCPLRGCEGPGEELPVFPFLLLFPGFSGAAFSRRDTGSCSLARCSGILCLERIQRSAGAWFYPPAASGKCRAFPPPFFPSSPFSDGAGAGGEKRSIW